RAQRHRGRGWARSLRLPEQFRACGGVQRLIRLFKSHAWPGLLGVFGLVVLFGLWWLGVALFGGDGLAALFSPKATLGSLVELLGRPELFEHVWVSLKRILVGLGLALLIGVPLGLLVGSSRNLRSEERRVGKECRSSG